MAPGVVHSRELWKFSPPRSGRQPDVCTPSLTESPTDQEVAEAGALLAEVGLLKERGLTAEAVIADFVFKNIQPLKDRAYPAYLYRGLADSTRVTDRRIPSTDLVSRLEMILRGKVSNVGAPVVYSAWNLPPPKALTLFVSNPPVTDGSLGLRVRPSAEEVSALVASLGEIPDDERQVHFEVPLNPSDAEISVMLDLLAEDSSDAAPAGALVVAPLPEADTTLDTQKPVSTRLRRPCRASQPDPSVDEQKKKKRRLRRVSSLDRDVGTSVQLGVRTSGCLPDRGGGENFHNSTPTLHRRLGRLQSTLHRQFPVPLRQAGATVGSQIHQASGRRNSPVVPQKVLDHEKPYPRGHGGGRDRRLLPGLQ
jgi:hypothetical protein